MCKNVSVLVTALATLALLTGLAMAQNPITFQVDMSVQIQAGNFNPQLDTVVVRGTFNGWTGSDPMLTDADNDSIYDGVFDVGPAGFNAGDTIEYKFVMLKSDGSVVWESIPNRKATVAGGAQTLPVVFWDDNPGGIDIEVTFQCNMGLQIQFGFFDPSTDVLDVRGDFNGWSAGWDLAPNIFNPDLYQGKFTIHQVPVPTTFGYKYTHNHGGQTNWEEPLSTGGGNRSFTVTGNEQDLDGNGVPDVVLDTVYWNDVTPDLVFLDTTDVIMEVDMRPAYAFLAINGQIVSAAPPGAIETSIDSVLIAGSSGQGVIPDLNWVWDNLNNPSLIIPLKMNDDGINGDLAAGDSVWSITLTFLPGASAIPTYKYGINAHDNEAGFAKNHQENLKSSGARHCDEFGEQDTFYTSVWSYGSPKCGAPVGINDPATLDVPESYKLFQNYPNPFNPSTTISYALTRMANVRLEVFNLLGQRVRTLVNGQVAPGVHRVVWDGRDDLGRELASGVYIYRLKANQFTETHKMILMK